MNRPCNMPMRIMLKLCGKRLNLERLITGQAEDRKIDAGNELRNLRLCEKEKISDYIARTRGLATKCGPFGFDVTERELAFYVV
ncbi:hypothetical protein AVEN_79189-1 [Araneus ventricosus]|uniref:Uncharacterized protein n=1 Tax=Araneus ventricosus TaxID=182803 RepID=A0A4Y2VDG3_ARAVE|nr:hypothetical protein AVEN_79189-1 [Araneus ventricosus]